MHSLLSPQTIDGDTGNTNKQAIMKSVHPEKSIDEEDLARTGREQSVSTSLIDQVLSFMTREEHTSTSQSKPSLHKVPTPEDDAKMEADLAREMFQLTVNEREKVHEEIHGVEQLVEETEEFLNEHLAALDAALQALSSSNTSSKVLKIANTRNPQYLRDRSFQLMFLRADSYDATKAAKRISLFLEEKLELFGLEALTRPILWSDLNKDDQEGLKKGYIRLLSVRDQAGRAILGDFQNLSVRWYKSPENVLRTVFYTLRCAVEDEETQRRGLGEFLFQ